MVVWMDFAENYSCVSLEEIQSAYWNATAISLHTMVVYSNSNGNSTRVQSYVAVSDVMSHNASSVYTILKKLVSLLKKEHPNLQAIHYLSDSPTRQCSNLYRCMKKNLQLKHGGATWKVATVRAPVMVSGPVSNDLLITPLNRERYPSSLQLIFFNGRIQQWHQEVKSNTWGTLRMIMIYQINS